MFSIKFVEMSGFAEKLMYLCVHTKTLKLLNMLKGCKIKLIDQAFSILLHRQLNLNLTTV